MYLRIFCDTWCIAIQIQKPSSNKRSFELGFLFLTPLWKRMLAVDTRSTKLLSKHSCEMTLQMCDRSVRWVWKRTMAFWRRMCEMRTECLRSAGLSARLWWSLRGVSAYAKKSQCDGLDFCLWNVLRITTDKRWWFPYKYSSSSSMFGNAHSKCCECHNAVINHSFHTYTHPHTHLYSNRRHTLARPTLTIPMAKQRARAWCTQIAQGQTLRSERRIPLREPCIFNLMWRHAGVCPRVRYGVHVLFVFAAVWSRLCLYIYIWFIMSFKLPVELNANWPWTWRCDLSRWSEAYTQWMMQSAHDHASCVCIGKK